MKDNNNKLFLKNNTNNKNLINENKDKIISLEYGNYYFSLRKKNKIYLFFSSLRFKLLIFSFILILLIIIKIITFFPRNKSIINSINNKNISNYSFNHNRKNQRKTFAILRKNCQTCGLFSFYIYYLGCLNKSLNLGYIPIIDLKSFPNTYNNYNESGNINPWDYLFEQPFGYTLQDVLNNKSLDYKIIYCVGETERPDERSIYYHQELINFWRNLSKKYLPIKNEIIQESKIIMKKLFGNSTNILGVKIRGTDYYIKKPRYHPIPPKIGDVILDVKNMTKKYKYDWIFFASEDEKIKKSFLKAFKKKVKHYFYNTTINYNYTKKEFFIMEKSVSGNLDYAKNYLINIYILCHCTDIIMTRGSGGAGIILLTNGFRHSLIYNLGEYK